MSALGVAVSTAFPMISALDLGRVHSVGDVRSTRRAEGTQKKAASDVAQIDDAPRNFFRAACAFPRSSSSSRRFSRRRRAAAALRAAVCASARPKTSSRASWAAKRRCSFTSSPRTLQTAGELPVSTARFRASIGARAREATRPTWVRGRARALRRCILPSDVVFFRSARPEFLLVPQ